MLFGPQLLGAGGGDGGDGGGNNGGSAQGQGKTFPKRPSRWAEAPPKVKYREDDIHRYSPVPIGWVKTGDIGDYWAQNWPSAELDKKGQKRVVTYVGGGLEAFFNQIKEHAIWSDQKKND